MERPFSAEESGPFVDSGNCHAAQAMCRCSTGLSACRQTCTGGRPISGGGDVQESTKALCTAIKRSQEKFWVELYARVEQDPWACSTKLSPRVGRAEPGSASRGRERKLMDHLFPSSPSLSVDWLSTLLGHTLLDEAVPEFTCWSLTPRPKDFPLVRPLGHAVFPTRFHLLCTPSTQICCWRYITRLLLHSRSRRCGKLHGWFSCTKVLVSWCITSRASGRCAYGTRRGNY